MNGDLKGKLPPRLTRADFASDEEYEEYVFLEEGDYDVPPLDPARKAQLEAAARNTLSGQRKRISIMMRNSDIEKLKAKAEKLGMPYQTLINSVLHQYAEEG
ncbi:MAG: DNA-binding protein [Nitratireductor sp.]|nr:DNA-binding protein [Nitratireductor sp.]